MFFQLAVHLVCLLVTWLSACHVTNGLPTDFFSRRHRRRHQHGTVPRSRHSDIVPPRFDMDVLPAPPFESDRVVFSERAPTSPPWFIDRSAASAIARLLSHDDQNNRTASNDEDDETDRRHHTGRQRRSVTPAADGHISLPSHPALLQPVCDSVSEWVQRFEAEDVWGHSVTVLQEIDNGSSRVNQYFYETRCTGANRRPNGLPPACSGIDSVLYESVCYESHVWAYAKVAQYSRSGDGWTFVKIRASCKCGLVLKSTLRQGYRLGLLHDIAG